MRNHNRKNLSEKTKIKHETTGSKKLSQRKTGTPALQRKLACPGYQWVRSVSASAAAGCK